METIEPISLCVDSRATEDLAGHGLAAAEVVEGLGNHLFAEAGPLVLAHASQEILCPFARENTRTPVSGSWFSPRWEKRFVSTKLISWMHRFLPLDQVNRSSGCNQITTLLPALGKNPFYVSRRNNHCFVVPSAADAAWLAKTYSIDRGQIRSILQGPRRSVILRSGFVSSGEQGIVVVRDSADDGFDAHVSLLRRNFPSYRFATVSLRDKSAVASARWLKTLQNSAACFYLVDKPLDGGVLALEALYCRVPVVFADGHRALSEQILSPKARLNHFLADPASLTELKTGAETERESLAARGHWDPDRQALEYRELYWDLGALVSN
jgi:hypothetical protein